MIMHKNSKRLLSAMMAASMSLSMVSQAIFAQDFETVQEVETVNEADKKGPGKPIVPKRTTVYELKTYLAEIEKLIEQHPNSETYKIQKQEVESILERYESTPVYRLYNHHTGEHLYTSDAGERDAIEKLGWKYEGVGWYAPVNVGLDVYRLYNPHEGDHHYTTSAEERDALVGYGWKYEGSDWKSMESDDVNAHPIYRQYNPNQYSANHNYSPTANERRTLVSYGWNDEGVGFYSLANYSAVEDAEGTKFYDNESMSQLTGWTEIYGDMYYLDPVTGYLATGEALIEGKYYYFDENGTVLKDTQVINGEKHYLSRETGEALTGYQVLSNSQTGNGPHIVYLNQQGVIMKNHEVDGMKFDENGDKVDLTTDEILLLNDMRVYDEVGRSLEGVYDWVVKNISDTKRDPSWPTPPADIAVTDYLAMEGFANRKGDCYIIAGTFAQLASDLGYNANLVKGALKTVSGQTEHAWVEITIDGKEYIFDPFMNADGKNFPKNYCYKQDKNNSTFVYIR